MTTTDKALLEHLEENFEDYTYDMFMMNIAKEPEEMELFSSYMDIVEAKKIYSYEAIRVGGQKSVVDVRRRTGEKMQLLNFSSFNYLGFSYHPEVIKAAQDAVAKHGLGASSSPVISGTYEVHKQLEQKLIEFFKLPDHSVSLFTSGYSANLGTIQAFIKPGNCILLDRSAHMSLIEGARQSGAKAIYFDHNDLGDLERLLQTHCDSYTRVLICIEGVYSGEGDYGKIKEIVHLAKQYGAFTLVDEAHSTLIAGENGRGVSEEQGVLSDVDLYVMTLSKAFGGVGGAVLAKSSIARYIDWFAKCRMFSSALDPAVTGGMVKVVELAAGEEGARRRLRIKENASYLRSLLRGRVFLGESDTWIVTFKYGEDKKTLMLNDYLQRKGLDTSIFQFPAVPKNEGRIRMFVTSEHTKSELEEAARIILDAAEQFNFKFSDIRT